MKKNEKNPDLDLDLFKQAFSDTGPVPSGQFDQPKDTQHPSIPGFEILELLGRGGMGAVYKARQVGMDRIVALKVMKRELADDAEFVQRFTSEARNAGKVRHENIVSALDCGQAGGFTYMVMEFIEGRSLAAILEEMGPVPERQALEWVRQVALGLQAAWDRRIIHRDIKPENILVTAEGVAKICDLGLSRTVGKDVHLTQTGVLLCTPAYASPEHARGERDLDTRTDIYSLGVTLYQLTTGALPFEGESGGALLIKHATEKPKPPIARNPELSPRVNRLILQMMEKSRSARPASPAALAQVIETILAEAARQAVGASARPSLRTRRRLGGTSSNRVLGMPVAGWIGCVVAAGAAIVTLLCFPGSPTPEPTPPPGPRPPASRTSAATSPPQGAAPERLVDAPRPPAPQPKPPEAVREPFPSPDATDRERADKARNSIRVAEEFARSQPADLEGQLRLYRAAAVDADGTPLAAEARKVLAGLEQRLKEAAVAKPLAEVEGRIREAESREEFKRALDLVEENRVRFSSASAVDERAASIRQGAASLLSSLKDKATDARKRGAEQEVKEIVTRVERWGLPALSNELASALALVASKAPPAGALPPKPAPQPAKDDVPKERVELEARKSALDESKKGLMTLEQAAKLHRAYMELAKDASGWDQYDIAISAASAAGVLAQNTQDKVGLTAANAMKGELTARKNEHKKAVEAAAKIAQGKDADACLVVGKFKCFIKENWAEGLTYLAVGSDAGLRKAAERDLSAKTVEEQVTAAESWLALQNKYQTARGSLQQRGLALYKSAWSKSSGSEREKLRSRLRALQGISAEPKHAGEPSGWLFVDPTYKKYLDPGVSRTGKNSIRIVRPLPPKFGEFSIVDSARILADPGKVYTLSAWVLSDGNDAARSYIALRWIDPQGNSMGQPELLLSVDTPIWTQVSGNFVCPAGAVRLDMQIGVSCASGTVFIDDVSLISDGREILENGSFEATGKSGRP